MTARIDEVAVPKFAVLELTVIHKYPLPLECLVLHKLNLVGAASLVVV